MDTLDVARIQFAATAGLHFTFVLLTLGLAPTVAIIETRYAITGKPVLQRMTRFWGQVYVINYALGILTGLVMEFQLGFAWKGLSQFTGNVFGAPIAIETLLAFFLESTFLAMWIFGWHRFGRWTHCLLIWLVTLTAYASALWIMVANVWMQDPVGFEVRDGVGRLTDFGAIVANPGVWFALPHIVGAAGLTAGFLMVGAGAWHFLRHRRLRLAVAKKRRATADDATRADVDLYLRTMRLGVLVAAVGSYLSLHYGFARLDYLRAEQPFKEALFTAVNSQAIGDLQQQMQGRFGPGDYAPPEWLATVSGVMETMGLTFFVLCLMLLPLLLPFNLIARFRPVLAALLVLPVLPFVSALCGWVYREVGRQPWAVYGELRVADALSPVGPTTLIVSLTAFTLLFAALLATNWWLILRAIGRGPDRAQLGAPPPTPQPAEKALAHL